MSPNGLAISKDENYAFSADWNKGLVIIDITDKTNPKVMKSYLP